MILVDTSIWVDHLHKGVPELALLLESGEVLIHPFVIGELACGNMKNRREVLTLLAELPRATVATEDEVLTLIEVQALMGRGLGYIDVHLLASVLLTEGTRFWTRDRTLGAVATEINAAHRPSD